jgi:iron complex transport system permease protein
MTDARLITGLSVLAGAAIAASLLLGATVLQLGDVAGALIGQGDVVFQTIVWEIRLPRALAACVVGACLGVSGAALQGLLRNPLADPGVLGVSASAALAASMTLYFGLAQALAWALPVAAVCGALAATACLAVAAAWAPSVATLILIGVGLSSVAGAAMALLMNLAPNPFSLSDMVNWMLGTVANRSLWDLAIAAPFAAAGLAILFGMGRSLTALTLGEEAAHGAGVNIARLRVLVVAGAGLATGAAVSLAGAVGFVGLVAAHLVRPLVGHDPQRTLLPAALLGGVILVIADIAVRVLPTQSELKLGVIAALIGGPVFMWIVALRGRAG